MGRSTKRTTLKLRDLRKNPYLKGLKENPEAKWEGKELYFTCMKDENGQKKEEGLSQLFGDYGRDLFINGIPPGKVNSKEEMAEKLTKNFSTEHYKLLNNHYTQRPSYLAFNPLQQMTVPPPEEGFPSYLHKGDFKQTLSLKDNILWLEFESKRYPLKDEDGKEIGFLLDPEGVKVRFKLTEKGFLFDSIETSSLLIASMFKGEAKLDKILEEGKKAKNDIESNYLSEKIVLEDLLERDELYPEGLYNETLCNLGELLLEEIESLKKKYPEFTSQFTSALKIIAETIKKPDQVEPQQIVEIAESFKGLKLPEPEKEKFCGNLLCFAGAASLVLSLAAAVAMPLLPITFALGVGAVVGASMLSAVLLAVGAKKIEDEVSLAKSHAEKIKPENLSKLSEFGKELKKFAGSLEKDKKDIESNQATIKGNQEYKEQLNAVKGSPGPEVKPDLEDSAQKIGRLK